MFDSYTENVTITIKHCDETGSREDHSGSLCCRGYAHHVQAAEIAN